MKGDFSRLSFKPKNHYASVRMQQGRVQIDSDWNEEMDIFDHRVQTETIDFIGGSGAPAGQDGYKIEIQNNNWTISKGRYYVNGLLCENESTINFTAQPDFPDAALPSSDGLYLAYLDVWQRGITAIEQPDIIESALNGIDTTTRLQNIAQVKYVTLDGTDLNASDCNTVFDPQATSGAAFNNQQIWQNLTEPSTGTLTPFVDSTPNFKNDLYRIEIHQGGDLQTATFKWASNNASLAARIKDIRLSIDSTNNVTTAIIQIASNSGILNFKPKQWVELSNNTQELYGTPGAFGYIFSIEGDTLNVTMIDSLTSSEEFIGGSIRVWGNVAESLKNNLETYSIAFITPSDADNNNSDTKVTLQQAAPIDVTANQFVLLTNQDLINNNENGVLSQIEGIDSSRKIITIRTAYSSISASQLTLLRFIEKASTANTTNSEPITIQNGLNIEFSEGTYKAGDYWLIPSRAVTNTIEWPIDSDNQFMAQSAHGIDHSFEKLAIIKIEHVDDQLQMTANDCRTVFSPLSSFSNLRAVEADTAAPEASIYIDNQGHIGIGTGKQALNHQLQVTGTLALEDNLKFISHADHQTEVLSLVAPFAIRGTGLKNNAPAFVKIANRIIYSTVNVSGAARGLNLIVLDKQTLNVVGDIINYDTFDTSTGATAANALADALNALTNQQIGILISYDAWLIDDNMTAYLKQAFINRGLYRAASAKNNTGDGCFPYAAIFEGEANQATSKAIEVLQNPYASSPYADLNGLFTDGTFTSSGATAPFQTTPCAYGVPLARDNGSINSDWIGNRWLPAGGTIPNMPEKKYAAASAVVKEKIYVIGGYDGNNINGSVFTLDTITQAWSACAAMKTARNYTAACALNNQIYVFGGQDSSGDALNKAERYDPVANTWTSLPAMKYSALGLGACAINELIYVMGGRSIDNTVFYTNLYAYDPNAAVDNSWIKLTNMPIGRAGACVNTVNGKIYVIGGRNGTNYIRQIDIYDPSSNQWMTLNSSSEQFSLPRRNAASCVIGENIYVLGGEDSTTNYKNVDMFNCNNNTWTKVVSLPIALNSATACQQDNIIYVMGGSTADNTVISDTNVFLP